MVITFVRRRLQFLAIALFASFQVSCDYAANIKHASFYRETTCTPAEFIGQTRQRLSDQRIGTTDPTTEGKELAISTESLVERSGNQERMSKYELIVRPLDYANRSAVTLRRVEGKTKGIRERKWYDDDETAPDPESRQQIWDQVKTICPQH
jgi:hypothetical protein